MFNSSQFNTIQFNGSRIGNFFRKLWGIVWTSHFYKGEVYTTKMYGGDVWTG